MTPFKMILQELSWHIPREVYVFDFIHNTYEALDTSALCWDSESQVWITVPISHLKPIIEEVKDGTSKKSLLE